MTHTTGVRERLTEILETTIALEPEGYRDESFISRAVHEIVALIEEEKDKAVSDFIKVNVGELPNKEQSTDKTFDEEVNHEASEFNKEHHQFEKPIKEAVDKSTAEQVKVLKEAGYFKVKDTEKPLEEKCPHGIKYNHDAEGNRYISCMKCFPPKSPEQSLTCEKHSRILIGKNKCVDCEKEAPEQPEDEGVKAIKKYGKLCAESFNEILAQVREEGFNKGYWERKKDDKEIKEINEADKAHRTAEGYCCACGYDMGVMADKIKKAKQEVIREIEKIFERYEAFGCYDYDGIATGMFEFVDKIKTTLSK